jgi:dolichyl-phosphate beta-glucosyltransferase
MSLCIVVPCYNEAERFPTSQFQAFIKNTSEVHLVLVDDGSIDTTLELLQHFSKKFSKQVSLLALNSNSGKAEAVRAGMLFAIETKAHTQLAYLDADLSTSLEECYRLSKQLNKKTKFIFGSRILKTDNRIERKWYRFLIGRLVATAISELLKISVYDTQCGCKLFDRRLILPAFEHKFSSEWLFDVEIFFRLINAYEKSSFLEMTKEVPLEQWVDTVDSRVKFSYMFRLWIDLYKIKRRYRK